MTVFLIAVFIAIFADSSRRSLYHCIEKWRIGTNPADEPLFNILFGKPAPNAQATNRIERINALSADMPMHWAALLPPIHSVRIIADERYSFFLVVVFDKLAISV